MTRSNEFIGSLKIGEAYHKTLTPLSASRVCAVAQEERTTGGDPKIGSMHIRKYCLVTGSIRNKKHKEINAQNIFGGDNTVEF